MTMPPSLPRFVLGYTASRALIAFGAWALIRGAREGFDPGKWVFMLTVCIAVGLLLSVFAWLRRPLVTPIDDMVREQR
jgi:hypothetical protein